jgi:thiamine biosynthesis lipoprotein
MTRRWAAAVLAVLAGRPDFPAGSAASSAVDSPQVVERRAYLMGTSVRLLTASPSRAEGLRALDAALARLEQTEQQLSTWLPASEISRLNRAPLGEMWQASSRLCRVLSDVFAWQHATGGAFDPGIGALTRAWAVGSGGRRASSAEVTAALDRSGLRWLSFDRSTCRLVKLRAIEVDVGAFGKGEGLDRAAESLGDRPWLIDLGGQVSASGSRPGEDGWTVELADPRNRRHAVARVRMKGGSLATSGGSERDATVEGRRVGHVIDPRTGRPAPFAGSVLAWHERALVADILSTALYVMGPEQGIAWAAERGLAAAYLASEGSVLRLTGTAEFIRRLKPESEHGGLVLESISALE